MRNNDWKLFCKIAGEEPYKEHTILQTPETITDNPAYYSYVYGERVPSDVKGRVVCTSRNEKGELIITRMRANAHQMIYGASGSCKTQGAVLGELANLDGHTSFIVFDTKAEVTPLVYARAAELYGKENVMVVNYMEPRHSNVRLNPLVNLARDWLKAEKLVGAEQKLARDTVITELRKFVDCAFEVKTAKDPMWEETAKDYIYAMLMGLIEDLTLTPEEERSVRRRRTLPHQVTLATVAKIFNTFNRSRDFDDYGFLSRRSKESLAYQLSKSARDTAPNTRACYMSFVQKYLTQYSDPKIVEMSCDDNFDIISMSETPKVLFLIYDQSDVAVRNWVNVVIANSMQMLLIHSHKSPSNKLKVPVVAIIDEFPTLRPNSIYPTILETGRGCNIFLSLVVQSLSQLKSRYPDDYTSMVNNCSLQTFLGTNDFETALEFSRKLGQTTVPDPQEFLRGRYSSQTVNVVTSDKLMHRMEYGESFICIDRQMPIHGRFSVHYNNPQYNRWPRVDIDQLKPIDGDEIPEEYDLFSLLNIKVISNDDDDLF